MNLETHVKATELLEEIEDVERTINLLENSGISYFRGYVEGKTVQIPIQGYLKSGLISTLATKKKRLQKEFKKL